MKTPIFCSLQPVEFLESLGLEPEYLTGDGIFSNGQSSNTCAFHDNLCPYVKGIFENIVTNEKDYGIIVVPTGCDAQKKLFNALISSIDRNKVFLLDFPHVKTKSAIEFLTDQLELLLKFAKLPLNPLDFSPKISKLAENSQKIGIFGSNLPISIIKSAIEAYGFQPLLINHCLEKSRPTEAGCAALKKNRMEYAKYHLEKNSCPRTFDDNYRKQLLEQIKLENLSGVIAMSYKFCDFQPFDYLFLRDNLPNDIPILQIEHEGLTNNEGQIMTRVHAFIEQLRGLKKSIHCRGQETYDHFVGIDSGSHATKMICLDKDGKIIFQKLVATGTSIQKGVDALLTELPSGKFYLTATGYGRNQMSKAKETITEITCHAKGVYHNKKEAGTIIDIGGQDSKAISLGPDGAIKRFAMNDKCAAGTGRFLEVIANRLELSLVEFSKLALTSKNSLPVSNMCAVFAESEVISMIAKGYATADIAKGIHKAIAERTAALVRRVDGKPPFFMTGGVAKNLAIVTALSKELETEICVLEEPQFSGALGAALNSLEKAT